MIVELYYYESFAFSCLIYIFSQAYIIRRGTHFSFISILFFDCPYHCLVHLPVFNSFVFFNGTLRYLTSGTVIDTTWSFESIRCDNRFPFGLFGISNRIFHDLFKEISIMLWLLFILCQIYIFTPPRLTNFRIDVYVMP